MSPRSIRHDVVASRNIYQGNNQTFANTHDCLQLANLFWNNLYPPLRLRKMKLWAPVESSLRAPESTTGAFWSLRVFESMPMNSNLLEGYSCTFSLVTKFSKAAQFATRPQRHRQSPATSSDWASQWCRSVSWQESFGLIRLLSEVRGQRDIGKRVDWRQEAERYRYHQPKYRSTWYFCW